jgi:hypothetical protein
MPPVNCAFTGLMRQTGTETEHKGYFLLNLAATMMLYDFNLTFILGPKVESPQINPTLQLIRRDVRDASPWLVFKLTRNSS